MSDTTAARGLLRIYLTDHLAGARAGVQLARRIAGSHRGTPLGSDIERLAAEIEEDRRTLQDLVGRLDVPRSLPKEVLAGVLEVVGRLKLNGRLVSRSPLSSLVELEGLSVGIEAKRLMWVALKEVGADWDAVGSMDLDDLVRRAEEQRAVVEGHRRAAAAGALHSGTPA